MTRIDFRFEPSPNRAQILDKLMRSTLADSLNYLMDVCSGSVSFDAVQLNALCRELRDTSKHLPASVFGYYYDLVIAIMAQEYQQASVLFDYIAQTRPLEAPQFSTLDNSMSPQLYKDKMLLDMPSGISFQSACINDFEIFSNIYNDAMALLDKVVPALSQEVSAIIHEVIAVTGAPSDKNIFQGGSHFQLWGALFINACLYDSRIAMAEVIAHESAHSLLFGFCTDAALVLNDDDELFDSPLRQDSRPMDGIYHATFVSARMCWALDQLLASNKLSNDEANYARRSIIENLAHFNDGYATVMAYAKLTAHGEALMANARNYMKSVNP